MWAEESVIYQIYPLGMCGAPYENDGVQAHRILEVKEWIPHLTKLGITAVYFCPVFESDTHGYNTRDYKKIDCRLGTNEDFKEVCEDLHAAGIRVILDGVFNHVGRGFSQFQDVLQRRWESPYKDWFNVSRRPLVRGLGGQLRPGQAQSQKRGSHRAYLRRDQVLGGLF